MKKSLKIIVGAIILIIALSFVFGGDIDEQVKKELSTIEIQVAKDAEKQYEIVRKNGVSIESYTQASLVAAAYLQAKDEENYNKWKQIADEEAKKVGL